MDFDGITITTGALSAIAGIFGTWLKMRPKIPQPLKTEIAPDPLNVHTEKKPAYVPVAECNRRMCEHAERMTRLEGEVKESNAAVIKKLDEIDSRAEERAQATHRRLDPMIGQVAANTEAIGNIKQLAFNATMGGKK